MKIKVIVATVFLTLLFLLTGDSSHDGKREAIPNLATVQTVDEIFVYRNGQESTYQLAQEDYGSYGDLGRRFGRETDPYIGYWDGAKTGRKETDQQRGTPSQERKKKATTFPKASSWRLISKELATRQKPLGIKITSDETDHECEHCKTHLCLPYVCEREFCEKNFAMVFGADWCIACPRMYPVIEQLRREGYFVVYINTDKHPKFTHNMKVGVWPTTLVMDGGKELVRIEGVTESNEIKKFLTKTQKEQEETDYVLRAE